MGIDRQDETKSSKRKNTPIKGTIPRKQVPAKAITKDTLDRKARIVGSDY